ncbi:hypothetical protein KC340_g4928 [Hortaea werneckii]|nr:hypothetical protein KC342_g5197 [Hortaea werneckii]KAI7101012.1 hypothetical protein KC339_g7050 [Hortaea werneckii]KAI7238778.1 hypothetical protein KC365_g4325 [Hortaea werneckii]KAI7328853.1 hypothetical protein KC340_g4928 [Hortaea werneckii]KAI7373654.1 hypothetical protein KC328_g16504 [Hortaea werneckii]
MAGQPHMNDLLSGSYEDPKTISAVRSLADQSRKREEIRQSLAELPVQQKLIQIITSNLAINPEGTLAALRCLGNGCIDNDTARSNLTTPSSSSAQETQSNHLHWAEFCLQSPNQEIRWTTVKVLYNLCTDHEESQQQLYRTRRVWYALLHLLVSPDTFSFPDREAKGNETEDGRKTVTPEERTLLIDLLFWITGQKAKVDQQEQKDETPERGTSSLPPAVLGKVLLLPYFYNLSTPSSSTEGEEIDLDEYATTLEITLTSLRDPSVQGEIVRSKWVEGVWRLFLDVEGKLCESERVLEGAGEGMGESTGEMMMMTMQQQQQQQLLRPLVSSWTWCLSDIAAQEGFGRVYDLEDPMVRELIGVVQSQGSLGTSSPQGEEEERDEAMARILTEAMESTADRDAFISSSALNRSRTQKSSAISSRETIQNVNPRRLSAACQILGNLLHALRAETVGAFVLQQHQQEQQTSLHQALWHYLSSQQHPSPSSSSTNFAHQQQAQNQHPAQQPKSPAASEQEEAQHSALSLLIQLTRPSSPQIREILGADANAEKALRLLWEGGGEGKNPGIPQGAVRLVRALGRECGVNRRRFEGLAGRMVERGLEEQQQQQQQQQRESAAGDGGSGDVGGSSGSGERVQRVDMPGGSSA